MCCGQQPVRCATGQPGFAGVHDSMIAVECLVRVRTVGRCPLLSHQGPLKPPSTTLPDNLLLQQACTQHSVCVVAATACCEHSLTLTGVVAAGEGLLRLRTVGRGVLIPVLPTLAMLSACTATLASLFTQFGPTSCQACQSPKPPMPCPRCMMIHAIHTACVSVAACSCGAHLLRFSNLRGQALGSTRSHERH